MHEILNFALNFHVVAFPWGNFLDIFQNFGNCLRAKFTRYVEIVLFNLFFIVKTTFIPNFMYMGPFFTNLSGKHKILKKVFGPKNPSVPRAKFSRYDRSCYFLLFSIVKTSFVPNFMYIEPFFLILLRKT